MRTLPECSVVIVGGGLASGLVARQLARQGVQTVVLERGGDNRDGAAGKIPTQRDELRWDTRLGLMQDAARETYTLRRSRDAAAQPMRRLSAFLPGTGVGGAGNHWGGQVWRWADYNMALRTRLETRYGRGAIPAEMPVQDWGVTYDELEPYHDLFERLFGVSGQAGNLRGQILAGGNPFEAPRRNPYPQAPLEATEAGLMFKETVEREFGYKPFPSPAANSSGPYVNPDGMHLGACQYCGHCDRFICEANAKGAPDVLLYPWLARQPGFELRTHSHVTGLDYDPVAKRVRGVKYLDLVTSEEVCQPGGAVVLAGFTLTNTRLLLGGGIGRPYDPVSGGGVVGKNFCYQANSGISMFFRDRWLNPFLAAGSTSTIIDEFNDDNFDHTGLGFFGGGYIGVGVTSGRPIAARRLPPRTPRWGSAWKQANADWYAHSCAIGVQGSCYPHRENYLDLDPDHTDAFGQPLLRLNFDWRDNEAKVSAYCTDRAHRIARAMGATQIGPVVSRASPFDTRYYQGSHVTGGTIMGADPATSVVSPRLQHWDAENLFVVGASVFAHNAGHNPTGPIGALALRLGDDLARYSSQPGRLS
ncbi:MAG: family oxidoreductase [Verrucomicrobia bacterium]|nr:family oxidoreductase [Verrucomicrobiota bacterium]